MEGGKRNDRFCVIKLKMYLVHFISFNNICFCCCCNKNNKVKSSTEAPVEFVQKEERERDLISHDSDTFACLTMNKKVAKAAASDAHEKNLCVCMPLDMLLYAIKWLGM